MRSVACIVFVALILVVSQCLAAEYEYEEYTDADYRGWQEDMTKGQNYKYVGCYKDTAKRAIPDKYIHKKKMSSKICVTLCRGLNGQYRIFGTQYGEHCFCGRAQVTKYDKYGQLSEKKCNTPCTDNPDEFCGGEWANSVYELN